MVCTALLRWSSMYASFLRYTETESLSSLEKTMLPQAFGNFGSTRWESRSWSCLYALKVLSLSPIITRNSDPTSGPRFTRVEKAVTSILTWYPKPRSSMMYTTSSPDDPAFMLPVILKPIFFTSLSWLQLLDWRKIRSNRLMNPCSKVFLEAKHIIPCQCPKDQTTIFKVYGQSCPFFKAAAASHDLIILSNRKDFSWKWKALSIKHAHWFYIP